MRLPQVRINPTSRVAAALHILYMILLPLLVWFIQAPWGFNWPVGAGLVIVLSKWRMFAVKPRYWLANVRANSVDIIVGFSVVIFMSNSAESSTALIWASLYSLWLIFLKPKSSALMVSLQAFIAQGLGLVAVFNNFSTWNPVYLVILAWVICFCSAKHLLVAFEDDMNRPLAHLWAMFAAEIALILNHWHIVYIGTIPLEALVLSVVGYALAFGYYMHKTRGLSKGLRQQLIVSAVILICLIVIFTEWQTETF